MAAGGQAELFDPADYDPATIAARGQLRDARMMIRQFVVEQNWAPDAHAVPSPYKGLQIGRAAMELETVSYATLSSYERRGRNLVAQYIASLPPAAAGDAGSLDDIEHLSAPSFVDWLMGRRPEISAATWRVYKQAGLAALREWPGDVAECLAAAEVLQSATSEGVFSVRRGMLKSRSGKARTSAKRSIAVTLEDVQAILEALGSLPARGLPAGSRYEVRDTLADWLLAALATGLRPAEWRQSRLVFQHEAALWPPVTLAMFKGVAAQPPHPAAEVVGNDWVPPPGRVYLAVHSTKHSNNRGNQPVRIMDLEGLPPEIMRAVARMVWRAGTDQAGWPKLQYNCAHTLSRLQAKLWPRRKDCITLYSARHQAMANWKMEVGTLEAAVLAGHGVVDGPTRYYARKSFAWKKGEKDKSGGGPVALKVAALAALLPPGRSPDEKASLLAKAGEAGLARLARADLLFDAAGAKANTPALTPATPAPSPPRARPPQAAPSEPDTSSPGLG